MLEAGTRQSLVCANTCLRRLHLQAAALVMHLSSSQQPAMHTPEQVRLVAVTINVGNAPGPCF